MKSLTRCLLLLLLFAFSACRKDDPEPDPAFVAGDLLVGFKPDAPIEQVFALANAHGFSLNTLTGFDYTSALPNDSLAYINKVLKTKLYLKQQGSTGRARLSAADGRLELVNGFFDMDLASQQDWLATIQQLQLIAKTDGLPYVFLHVPVGEEKFWQAELQKNALVRYAELNAIVTLDHH